LQLDHTLCSLSIFVKQLISITEGCILKQQTELNIITCQYLLLNFLRNVWPNRIMHTCSLQRGLFYLQTAQRESEWSNPDWKFWDLWILIIKRTRVSLIRPCALINNSLLWTLTILDGNRAVAWCGFLTSLLAWLLRSMTRKLVCADCRLSLKCTNLYIYVWRPHIRIRMGRVCRVCILSYALPSVCIWNMAVRSGMAIPTRSCLILLWPYVGCIWSLVCSISCVIRSPGRVPPSFCGLQFMRVVNVDGLFCVDSNFAMEIGVDSKIWKQHVTSQGIW
jgi:hypothetical protein